MILLYEIKQSNLLSMNAKKGYCSYKKELKKYSESIPNFPKIKINYEKKYSKYYYSNYNLLR